MPTSLSIFTDGGARGNPGPAGIGAYVVDENGTVIHQIAQTIGDSTNNEAEYQAILASLKWVLTYPDLVQLQKIEWKLDSLLVVSQLNKKWKIKEARLQALAAQAWEMVAQLPCSYSITHVFREQNREADRLVNAALDGKMV
jgi:ribonuclease HI